MADNVAITAGSGTSIAADDISSVWYQRVKVTWGVDGTATDTSATNPLPVRQIGLSSGGGLSMYSLSAAGSTNATAVKASAGQVYHLAVTNKSTSARYFRLYNLASGANAGNSTGLVWRIAVPAGGGYVQDFPLGLAFSTGISFSTTASAVDGTATAVTADDMQINIAYV